MLGENPSYFLKFLDDHFVSEINLSQGEEDPFSADDASNCQAKVLTYPGEGKTSYKSTNDVKGGIASLPNFIEAVNSDFSSKTTSQFAGEEPLNETGAKTGKQCEDGDRSHVSQTGAYSARRDVVYKNLLRNLRKNLWESFSKSLSKDSAKKIGKK